MLNESDTVFLLPDTRALLHERTRPRAIQRGAPLLVALLAIAGTLMLRAARAEPTAGAPSGAERTSALLPSPSSPTTPTALKAPPEPAAPGVLDIDSTPVSHVLIDGRPLGATPRSRESVSPGRHVVVFVYSPGVSCRQSIQVTPGASATVTDRLDAPSTPERRCRRTGTDPR